MTQSRSKKAKTKKPSKELSRLFPGVRKTAYRPRLQDTPGYKTLVDRDSELGVFPDETDDNGDLSEGQTNLDSAFPVELPQGRTKQRALPLPSNHDKLRDKRIGPTYYNKNRKYPVRTKSVPGEDYGHPTKFDYNMPTRRHEVLAVEREAVVIPKTPQKRNVGSDARKRQRLYRQKAPRLRVENKLRYKKLKRNPQFRLRNKMRKKYPNRYKRRGVDNRTNAERSRDWRKENQSREAACLLVKEAATILKLGIWPSGWNTLLKDTQSPEQLDQNYGNGQSRNTGIPRLNVQKQEGESLRTPNLSQKEQRGLQWELDPPASGGLDYPVVFSMNPTDGSGKVIPPSWYTDMANNTQAIPDGGSDRYLRNNNFDVKTAATLADLLARCDKKIKLRSEDYRPNLLRTDTKNWLWHWGVGKYKVRVQVFKKGNAKTLGKLNLKLSCTCPYWRWWGPAHWAERADYQKGKAPGTAEYPSVRDPAKWRPFCKHVYAVLSKSQAFQVNPKKNPLKKLSSLSCSDAKHEDGRTPKEPAQKAHLSLMSERVASRYLEKKVTK